MMRPALLPLVFVVCTATAGAGDRSADFETGMQAMERGDYAIAYLHWLPLAERGHAEAQYNLGWLYANGNGLAVDIEKAMSWWLKAARQGDTDAQFAIALAYTTGEGVGKDLEEAFRWYLAAARQGHEDAREILLRLSADPGLDLMHSHPELYREPWFGWRARANRDGINVRAGAGTGYRVVTQLATGQEVRVVGQRDDWLMVMLPNAPSGEPVWIFSRLLTRVDR
jgi:hypothetical protein